MEHSSREIHRVALYRHDDFIISHCTHEGYSFRPWTSYQCVVILAITLSHTQSHDNRLDETLNFEKQPQTYK